MHLPNWTSKVDPLHDQNSKFEAQSDFPSYSIFCGKTVENCKPESTLKPLIPLFSNDDVLAFFGPKFLAKTIAWKLILLTFPILSL